MKQDELQNIEEDNGSWTNKSKDGVNRIMGIAAIFISVLSMIAVIYQSYLAREENELNRIQQSASVLPYLSQWYSDIDGNYKFVIANKGVGPALLKEVKFKAIDLQSKEISIFNSNHELIHFMMQKSEIIDTISWVINDFQQNMFISNSEIIDVFTFPFKNTTEELLIKNEFDNIFIGFEIIYQDVYGSSWILNSNKGYPEELNIE